MYISFNERELNSDEIESDFAERFVDTFENPIFAQRS